MLIDIDRTNFPLIKIDPINAFMHVLPITKIQFERFLCDPYASPNSQEYDSIVTLNPRISPSGFNTDEACKIFATAILPDEINRVANWLGPNYRLPKLAEWQAAIEWLGKIDVESFYKSIYSKKALNSLARELLQKIYEVYSVKTALDLCLYLNVIMEWTKDINEPKPLALVGNADPRLFSSMARERTDYFSPMYPIDNEKRIAHAGFRLIRV